MRWKRSTFAATDKRRAALAEAPKQSWAAGAKLIRREDELRRDGHTIKIVSLTSSGRLAGLAFKRRAHEPRQMIRVTSTLGATCGTGKTSKSSAGGDRLVTNSAQLGARRCDLSFSCACGVVTGTLVKAGPSVGDYVVCHCTDCQAFATRLGAAERILDRHAGTALYQGRCATMRLSTGRDQLACLHLTEKPTLRWYARCCDTPMFNTYKNGRIPYITTVVANCDRDQRGPVLGEPIGHLFTKEATGDASQLTRLSMAKLMRRFFWRMIADLMARDRTRSELFDPVTLESIVAPRRLGGSHVAS